MRARNATPVEVKRSFPSFLIMCSSSTALCQQVQRFITLGQCDSGTPARLFLTMRSLDSATRVCDHAACRTTDQRSDRLPSLSRNTVVLPMDKWGAELALLLGIVEGLTEFLPISSTGHLIIVGHLLGFTGAVATSVEISIQLGAILAVIAYERQKLALFLSHSFQELAAFRAMTRDRRPGRPGATREGWRAALHRSASEHRNLWFFIGLASAFLPAAVVGLLTRSWIETYLFTPQTVAASLIIGGLIILGVESLADRVRFSQLDQIRIPTALWVGLAQCAALIPGVSRSGATIIGGLLAGMDRRLATEYSFFLALPTMIAATVYKTLQSTDLLTGEDFLALALGMLVAFLVAWAVIAVFLAFVKRHTLHIFAYYRILLGVAVLFAFQ